MGLPMAPTETPTAAKQDKPLFLQSGDVIYSVRLSDRVPSLSPVGRWTTHSFRAMTACGSTILGLLKGSSTVVVHDTVTLAATPGPRLRSDKRRPVMLAVGDDTVVVMDTILRRRRDGSSGCCFEALRRLPGGGGWRADPLPDAPVQDLEDELEDDYYNEDLEDELEDDYYSEDLEDELEEDYYNEYYDKMPVDVSPYFVMGTRLWMSVWGVTFSLEVSSGEWRVEGSWQLPALQHRVIFVKELGCAVGVVPSYDSSRCHQVCAIDVIEAQKEHRAPVLRHVWKFRAERADGVPPAEFIALTYLGNGTFCLARCVIVDHCRGRGRGTSFTLLDLDFTGADGEPQLVKRGEPHVHAWPPGGSGMVGLF